jgi:hypothetical protein
MKTAEINELIDVYDENILRDQPQDTTPFAQ